MTTDRDRGGRWGRLSEVDGRPQRAPAALVYVDGIVYHYDLGCPQIVNRAALAAMPETRAHYGLVTRLHCIACCP